MNLNVNSFITRVNSRKQSSFLCIQWKLLVRQINKRNFQWYPGFLLCDPPPPPPPPPPPSSLELEWTLVGTLSEWLSRESSLLSYLQMAGIFGLPDRHDTETRVTRLILHAEEIYPAPVLLVPEIECKYLILRSQSKLFPSYSDILTYISGLFHKILWRQFSNNLYMYMFTKAIHYRSFGSVLISSVSSSTKQKK